jgi:hypothetical protein
VIWKRISFLQFRNSMSYLPISTRPGLPSLVLFIVPQTRFLTYENIPILTHYSFAIHCLFAFLHQRYTKLPKQGIQQTTASGTTIPVAFLLTLLCFFPHSLQPHRASKQPPPLSESESSHLAFPYLLVTAASGHDCCTSYAPALWKRAGLHMGSLSLLHVAGREIPRWACCALGMG